MATNRQLASYHARSLKRISKELRKLSVEWDDVDNWISSRFEDAAGSIDLLKSQLIESFKEERNHEE
ncbi:hypothetical protein [Serratia fonticola]